MNYKNNKIVYSRCFNIIVEIVTSKLE